MTLVEVAPRDVDSVPCMVAAEITRPHRSPFATTGSSGSVESPRHNGGLQPRDLPPSLRTPLSHHPDPFAASPTTSVTPDIFVRGEYPASPDALLALLAYSAQQASANGRPTLQALVGDPGVYLCATQLPRGSRRRRTALPMEPGASRSGLGDTVGLPLELQASWDDVPRRQVVRVPLSASVFVTLRSNHPDEWQAAVEGGGLSWVETGFLGGHITTLTVRRSFFKSLAQRLLSWE